MSIAQFSDGILRTNVSWEEIEQNCKDVFGSELSFGPNKSVKSIGDGRGYLSKMCLIDPDWTTEVGDEVPKKFVVKICCLLQMLECQDHFKDSDNPMDPAVVEQMIKTMVTSALKLHNAEVRLYKILDDHQIKSFLRPKIYYSQEFTEENKTKGYLIMSYIDGTESINLQHNFGIEDMKKPLRALAAFEALTLQLSDDERKAFTMNPFKDLFGELFRETTVKVMLDLCRKHGGPEMGSIMDKLEKIIPDVIDIDSILKIPSDLEMDDVLVHGDLWSTNMLWRKCSDGSHDLAAILDFQTSHIGMACQDICRLLAAGMSGKDRRENWEHLAEVFFEYLTEEVGDGKMPYTLEQLKESMRRYTPMAHFMLAPMIGPVLEYNNKLSGTESSAEVKDIVSEKGLALFEDLIEYHERNQKLRAEGAFGGPKETQSS